MQWWVSLHGVQVIYLIFFFFFFFWNSETPNFYDCIKVDIYCWPVLLILFVAFADLIEEVAAYLIVYVIVFMCMLL